MAVGLKTSGFPFQRLRQRPRFELLETRLTPAAVSADALSAIPAPLATASENPSSAQTALPNAHDDKTITLHDSSSAPEISVPVLHAKDVDHVFASLAAEAEDFTHATLLLGASRQPKTTVFVPLSQPARHANDFIQPVAAPLTEPNFLGQPGVGFWQEAANALPTPMPQLREAGSSPTPAPRSEPAPVHTPEANRDAPPPIPVEPAPPASIPADDAPRPMETSLTSAKPRAASWPAALACCFAAPFFDVRTSQGRGTHTQDGSRAPPGRRRNHRRNNKRGRTRVRPRFFLGCMKPLYAEGVASHSPGSRGFASAPWGNGRMESSTPKGLHPARCVWR
jgi:hypothetical protein